MKLKLIYLLLLLSGVLMYNQKDYIFEFERIELVSFNKAYLMGSKVVTYKYNRTYPAINATFVIAIDLGNAVEVIAQAYTFMSNEYRLFPLHLGFNLCDTINNNDFGLGEISKHGNFTGCPIKKNTYCFYKWAPDPSRFPPFIPNGKYMVELQAILSNSTELAFLRLYATISRPLGRRH